MRERRFDTRKSRSLVPLVAFLLGACASAQTISEFSLPNGDHTPLHIAAGPDGNLWFTETSLSGRIGRITPTGILTEFSLPSIGDFATPISIAAGPDGNLWYVRLDLDSAFSRIGRLTPSGIAAEFPLETLLPEDIVAGPDGNLWFTTRTIQTCCPDTISRITPGGAITSFPVSGGPVSITVGPDGNLWFTEFLGGKIGRITTAGQITEFSVPRSPSGLQGITSGPDGNVWFAESIANKIGRITPSGVVTEFPIPTAVSGPNEITTGPDGNLWFTERNANRIGRITTAGVFTEFPVPTAGSVPFGITTGPDGNIWFTETGVGRIGRLTLTGSPAIDSRILPVVGSTAGVGGSFFRTSIQLHNSTSTAITGRIVFHPSGASGGGSDSALSYTLSPGQTQSIPDLLPAMGRSGLGTADVEATSGSIPTATVRVFNDAGAAGTMGFTEELMRAEEALQPGPPGVLLLPADVTRFRFNLGVRTLEAGATATLTVRDASGAAVATVPRAFPATYHEQQSASAFLGVSTLPAGGSITITVSAGAAIFYGATVDNRTGDPSLQIARATGP